MDIKVFTKRFKMLQNAVKYAKGDDALQDWYQLAQSMSDAEIDRAFSVCISTMKEWPAWSEFKEAGQKGAVLDIEDEAAKMTAEIMAAFSNPRAIPESSMGLRYAAGEEFFKRLGGHTYWYDIMNGDRGCYVPTEAQMYKKVLAFLREKKNDEVNEKLLLGGSDAKRLPAPN